MFVSLCVCLLLEHFKMAEGRGIKFEKVVDYDLE